MGRTRDQPPPVWDKMVRSSVLILVPLSTPPQDPLFRFFEREVKMGGKMLQEIRQDLTDVVQVCEGKKKQTNDLRTLVNDLVKGEPLLAAPPSPPVLRCDGSRSLLFCSCHFTLWLDAAGAVHAVKFSLVTPAGGMLTLRPCSGAQRVK